MTIFLMDRILDSDKCETQKNRDRTNNNNGCYSIHSDFLEPREPLQAAVSAWQLDNFKTEDGNIKTEDGCRIKPSSDLPDICQNGNNSVIGIQNVSRKRNGQAEPDIITLSDSESDSFSLPDIVDSFDYYSPRSPSATNQSARNPPKLSPQTGVIYISEDSLDSDLLDISNDDDLGPLEIVDERSPKESSPKESSLVSIPANCHKRANGRLSDSGNNFIEDTDRYICPNKDNDRGCDICMSALNSNSFTVSSSLPLPTFVLPFSLQPYANYTNLSVKDLKDQPQVTVELIQSCLEEGTQFALSTANISCQYLYAYRPTQQTLGNLLKWIQQRDIGFTQENGELLRLPYFKLYGLLNELFHCYPENVSILWDAVCERMLTIHLDENVFLNLAVMLDIYLSVLEGEFFQLPEPKKSQVYRLMANDERYPNTKKIIQCLSRVVVILCDKNLTLGEQVLCQLQKLMELAVVVSLRNGMMAKRIAKDLVGVYRSIPFLNVRQRFLSTIQSDLIRFKLLEILLEKYCGETILAWNYMPENIADIAKSFFRATPMKTTLLDDSIVISLDGLNSISPSRIEELIMMIYFAITSYIALLQGSFYHLSESHDREGFFIVEPVCNGSIPPPWNNRLSQLKDLPRYISQLNKHIRDFDVELSQGSLLYLMMLDHLTDLMDEKVTLSVF